MTNPLNLNAPVDTLAMEFTREFDAPVEALFRAHAEPDLRCLPSNSRRLGDDHIPLPLYYRLVVRR